MRKIALLAMTVILAGTLWGCAGGEEADKTAPTISGVSASDVTQTSATITWTTDEPATSQVEYGLTTSYGTTTALDDELVTSHSASLSGLDPSTTYHYRVKSEDESDNEAVSGDYTFTTSKIFPDENLEAAVREAIGKPEGPIHVSDLEGMSSLDAPSRGIANVAGLEYCTDLVELRLRDNQVSDISSLANLASLTHLRLDQNQISDISSLSNLTSLTYLRLNQNQISDITALEGITNLTSLFLWENEIDDIDSLANLTRLTYLDVGHNQIEAIAALEDLTSLTTLSLYSNQIDDISPVENFTSLTLLVLFDNQISDISSLENLDSLEELRLHDNNIADITALVNNTGLASGDSIDLRENPLNNESLCTLIPQLEARGVEVLYGELEVTFPDANLEAAIREAIGKPEGAIDVCDLAGLTSLDASGRDITSITGLEYCHDLTNLYLDHNQISDITPLSSLTDLTWLSMYGNQISELTPLGNMTSLTALLLSNNQVSDVTPLSDLTSLTRLEAYNNQISDLAALSNLTELTYLRLDNNQVIDIMPLENLTDLETLSLASNQVSDISPLESLTGLTTLDLHSNQIDDISSLEDLTNLLTLILAGNEITGITPLQNLTSLTGVSLQNCEVSDISPLANLTDLGYLGLKDNQISDITPLVDNTGLGEGDEVDLRGNPLSGESLCTLIPQLEARGVEVQYDEPLACIAYIYMSDTEGANGYEMFLEDNDYSVTLTSMDNVAATDFSIYDLILVGADTSTIPYEWGTAESVNAIDSSGKSIIGFGYGGACLFGKLGLSIDSGNTMGSAWDSIYVVDPTHDIFTSPHLIAVPQDQIVQLYSHGVAVELQHDLGLALDVVLLGQDTQHTSHYPLVQEGKYIFWGFQAPPDDMTQIGKDLFLNVVNFMLGAS